MNSNFFTLSWKDVKSAIVYGLLIAILTVLIFIKTAGSIYSIDWKTALDMFVISLITSGVSLLKSLLTTSDGKFVGLIKVK